MLVFFLRVRVDFCERDETQTSDLLHDSEMNTSDRSCAYYDQLQNLDHLEANL